MPRPCQVPAKCGKLMQELQLFVITSRQQAASINLLLRPYPHAMLWATKRDCPRSRHTSGRTSGHTSPDNRETRHTFSPTEYRLADTPTATPLGLNFTPRLKAHRVFRPALSTRPALLRRRLRQFSKWAAVWTRYVPAYTVWLRLTIELDIEGEHVEATRGLVNLTCY